MQRKSQTGVLKREIDGCSFRTPVGVEVQADVGFELELVAVCTALQNARLLGLWVSIKEQQKLLVQKPEHKPDNAAFGLNHLSTFRAAEAPSNGPIAATLISPKTDPDSTETTDRTSPQLT